MPIHRVKIKDIDQAFLQKLHAEVGHEEAEVAIWVPGKPDEAVLPEDTFWDILAELDWSRERDHKAVLEPAIRRLGRFKEAAILTFNDFLSEKLYLLDTQSHAENTGENAYRGPDHPFSADDFLYARCYVVAQGKDFFYRVLENPEQMPNDKTFESLLRLAAEAYRRKTGQAMKHHPAYPIETFSNPDGWNGEGLFEKILAS